jgi:hypothetical protein
VTLIAAIRCPDGVALFADSQETVGEIRVGLNKLAPQDAGNYQLAIAGSGNGDLIDGFAYKLKLDMESWPADLDEKAVYGCLEALLQNYYENQVFYYPEDSASDKQNDFLVCIKPRSRPDIFLWQLRSTAIYPVPEHVLLGMAAPIYQHELTRLYNKKLSSLQAVLLGVHLFTLARNTSNYVGGPTEIIFVSEQGMAVETEDMRFLEGQLTRFNESVSELILLCPDTGRSDNEVREAFDQLRDAVLYVRPKIKSTVAFTSIMHSLTKDGYDMLYRKLPVGDHEGMLKGIADARARRAQKPGSGEADPPE